MKNESSMVKAVCLLCQLKEGVSCTILSTNE